MTPSLRTTPLRPTRLRLGTTRTLLAAAVLVLALAAAATSFSGASLTAHSNAAASLAAGTLRLTDSAGGQALLSSAPLAPGRSASGALTLTNAGDLSATLRLSAAALADAPAGSGLSSALQLTVSDHASGATLWSGSPAALAGGADLGALAPGASRALDVVVSWPSGAREPALQGASTTLELRWRASSATFTSTASNPQTVSAVADFVAPSASSAVVQKTLGGVPGYVRPGGSYRLFANVADSGSPPSGIASATADLSALTPGAATAALAPGAFSAGGQSYDHATGTLVAGSIATGPAAFSLTLADALGNAATQSFPAGVVVDGTASHAVDVQAANGGAQAGVIEPGDSLTYSYSEPIDPISLIPGWDGSATAVTATVANLPVADAVTVSDGGAAVPLGIVTLNSKYVSASATFNATLRASGNDVVLVLGAMTAGKTRVGTTATMAWTPAAGAFDRAGNPALTTPASESGGTDKDF